MIIWLLGLPLATAVVLLVVGRWRLIAAPLACAVLFVMAGLLVLMVEAESATVAGRALGLGLNQAVPLCLALALLSVTIWATYRAPRLPGHYALCLAGVAALVAGLAMRNMTLSGLLLGIGAVLSAMLVPDEHARSPRTGMQVLVQVVLGAMMLVIAGWALEGAEVQDAGRLTQLGGALYVLGFGLVIGIAPFHLAVAPLFRQGNVLAILMLRVLVPTVLIARLLPEMQSASWPGGEVFFGTVLYWGGIATVIVGALSAISQHELGTTLAYASLADLGIVLVSLGLGSSESVHMGIAHLASHAAAVTLACMGLQSARMVVDQDDVSQLGGLVRRAPWACLSLVVGCLSLAGFPGTAGFFSRVAIYRLLAMDSRSWAIYLLVVCVGPGWAVLRCAMAALVPAAQPDARREVRWMGLLGVPLAVLICVPYLLARFPAWLPTGWLRGLLGY